MPDLEPTALGVALAAIGLALAVILLVEKIVLPRLRERNVVKKGTHEHDSNIYCQVGKYESRISKLEQHGTGVDGRLRKFEKKIDAISENTGAIAVDMAKVKEAVEWMRDDHKKRNGDA